MRLALRFPGCDLFPRPRKGLFFSRSIIFPPPLTAVPITDTTNSYTTQPTETMATFTYQDVAEHNTKKDLYVVIHDEVFDVSKFVDEHP